jgi:hypothetical protein
MRKLLLALAGIVALAATLVAQTRFVSGRFAVRTEVDRSTLVVFDEAGAELRMIELRGRVPAFGAQHVALLAPPAPDATRPVELLDARGETIARFLVPDQQELVVGAASLALRPAAPHRPATPFEIEFLTLGGRPLGRAAVDGERLASLTAAPGGHWLAFSTDEGGTRVHAFDPSGTPLWSFAGGATFPTAGLSASGDRAAIGVVHDDLQTATLSLLDHAGAVLATAEVPAFGLVAFSHDERRVVVAGGDALAVLDTANGNLLLARTGGPPLVRGEALALAEDGQRALLVARDVAPDGRPGGTVLLSVSGLLGRPVLTARALGLTWDPDDAVLELSARADGTLRLVTSRASLLATR